MFDEIITRASLATKITPGFLVVARFGLERVKSLVAISHTLDKLIVYECNLDQKLSIGSANSELINNSQSDNFDDRPSSKASTSYKFSRDNSVIADSQANNNNAFYYISIRDIIKSLATRSLWHSSSSLEDTATSQPYHDQRDLLLIGCVNSIIIYDTLTQSKQINVNTSGPVELVALIACDDQDQTEAFTIHSNSLITCYGAQKLYTLRLDSADSAELISTNDEQYGNLRNNINQSHIVGELTSTRSIGDTITCLIQGSYNAQGAQDLDVIGEPHNGQLADQLVVTGSRESQIRLWPLDNFDQNLQACRVVIEELGPITCLCPINTTTSEAINSSQTPTADHDDAKLHNPLLDRAAGSRGPSPMGLQSSLNNNNRYRLAESPLLPPVAVQQQQQHLEPARGSSSGVAHSKQPGEQMNYFAFGLENNYIGVYRLYSPSSNLIGPALNQVADQWQAASSVRALDAIPPGLLDEPSGLPILNETSSAFQCERLWRLKSRHKPVQMLMCDLNGDGQDELVIGYENGRLEARGPFTGQLMGATRCFRSSDSLASIATIAYDMFNSSSARLALVALSKRGNLVAYKPPNSQLPRQPLRAYTGGFVTTYASNGSVQQSQATKSADLGGFGDEMLSIMMQPSTMVVTSDATTTLIGDQSNNNATIELEDDERRQDKGRPRFAEPRQNLDLLHKLNTLESQLLDVQRESGMLLMQKLKQEAKLLQNQDQATILNVAHQWDFDFDKLAIKLTISFSSPKEKLQMIELLDEKKVFFASGCCLIDGQRKSRISSTKLSPSDMKNQDQQSATSATSLEVEQQQQQTAASNVKWSGEMVTVYARPLRNQATILLVKVHCCPRTRPQHQHSSDTVKSHDATVKQQRSMVKSVLVSRVCTRSIKVPRYNMYVSLPGVTDRLAMLQQNETTRRKKRRLQDNDQHQATSIRLAYSLKDADSFIITVSEWAHENFLCFQFVNIIEASENVVAPITTSVAEVASNSLQETLHKLNQLLDQYNHDNTIGEQANLNLDNQQEEQAKFEISFLDLRRILKLLNDHSQPLAKVLEKFIIDCKQGELASHLGLVRLAIYNRRLEFECSDSELMVDILQSLDIQAMQLPLLEHEIDCLTVQLEQMIDKEHQLEESETRTQSELYESADYTKYLMRQLDSAIELDEYSTSKDLLNELSIMLNGAQNAAQAHKLNSDRRAKLCQEIETLKYTISQLIGQHEQANGG